MVDGTISTCPFCKTGLADSGACENRECRLWTDHIEDWVDFGGPGEFGIKGKKTGSFDTEEEARGVAILTTKSLIVRMIEMGILEDKEK